MQLLQLVDAIPLVRGVHDGPFHKPKVIYAYRG
jgi:hypothetical protein